MNQTLPQIKWNDLVVLLSPDGQRQLVDFVRKARDDRGAKWLPEVKAEFPMFTWIVELVCNRTADEAFAQIQAEFAGLPLRLVKPQLLQLHATLKTEIERKR